MSDSPTNGAPRTSLVDRFLRIIERGGNALPHPATLFLILTLFVVLLSAICSWAGLTALHPNPQDGTSPVIEPRNLLSIHGIHYMMTSLVENFTGFAPLGTVLVAMLGIGIAEGSGLIGTALRLLVLKAPARLLTLAIVFTGVLSNTASEIGYVLLIPLAGTIFLAAGRHPLAGMAAAFAGVSGGYSANLLLGTVDPLLSGLTQEAAHVIEETYSVSAACNLYFMMVSTFFITFLGTWVTDKIVEPRLGKYRGDEALDESSMLRPLDRDEKRGLTYASLTLLVIVAVILIGTLPANGFLRNPETGGLSKSPLLQGIVTLIFLGAAAMGIAYGIGARTIRSDADVMKGMAKSMETLGAYIVLVFFAAQFVRFFGHSNLGTIFAVKGAHFLESSGLPSIPLIIAFIAVCAIFNLFMGSASAKWGLMAPVFVPMFMLLGYSPEFTQVAYRIGDSVTNIISPMMSYFALIVAFFQRYDKQAGIGTLISTMLPYTFAFFIIWTILLVTWFWLGLPIGPDAPLTYTTPTVPAPPS